MAKLSLKAIQKWWKLLKDHPIWKRHSKWEWVVIVVGMLTIFYLLINLFTSLGEQTPPPYSTATSTLSDMGTFEATLSSAVNSPTEQGSPVTVLTNGAEFLPDILNEIANAKTSINATDYIWDDGDFGNTLLQALIRKAHEGVKVRLLLDGNGGHKANKDYIKQLKEAGGNVAFFRPITWWNITRIDRRSHVRDFVIDGEIAYMGGIAISDAWEGDATSTKSWHDFMFKTRGRMAERSGEIFANMWSQTTGEVFANSIPKTASSTSKVGEEKESSIRFLPLLSAPAPDMSSNMEHFIWASISGGEKSIHIENPYLVPSGSVMKALEERARAGVDVKIIVPSATDAKTVKWASESFYGELLDAGVRIFEYQPSLLHAKIILVDGIWSVIGSANLDNRSSEINLEYIIGVEDPALTKDLETHFQEDLKNSKEVEKGSWKNNPLLHPLGLISRAFIQQY